MVETLVASVRVTVGRNFCLPHRYTGMENDGRHKLYFFLRDMGMRQKIKPPMGFETLRDQTGKEQQPLHRVMAAMPLMPAPRLGIIRHQRHNNQATRELPPPPYSACPTIFLLSRPLSARLSGQ